MNLDIEKAFSYAFEDPDWMTKLGILAGAVLLLGVLSFLILPALAIAVVVAGYTVAILRNVAAGEPRPLPSWDHAGEFLMDGVKLTIIFVVYALPLIVLGGIPLAMLIAGGLLSGNGEGAVRALAGASVAVICALACVLLLYAIALSLWQPAVMILYSRTRDIRVGFRFAEILGYIRANSGQYLIAWFVAFLVSLIPLILSSVISAIPVVNFLMICIAPLLGPIAAAYGAVVSGHLYGQLSRATAGTSNVVGAVNPAL